MQHYVPRFYLRNFAKASGKEYLIQVYDKIENRSFRPNITKIGAEKFFYESYSDGQKMEKDLSHFEAKYNKVYMKLLDKQDISCLNEEERDILANFIVMQEIRTRETRDLIGDLRKSVKEKLLKHELSSDFEKEVMVVDDKEKIKEQQLSMMKNISEFVDIVKSMKWVLVINNTDRGFWTSDHPIVRINRTKAEFPFGNMGYKSEGIELHFPLSPNMAFIILDPVKFNRLDEKYEISDKENVKYENHIQLRNATRFVYSNDEDFSFAEKILEDDRDALTPSRFSIHGLDVEKE